MTPVLLGVFRVILEMQGTIVIGEGGEGFNGCTISVL